MSLTGQSLQIVAHRKLLHVRNAPLATVGPKEAACRDGRTLQIKNTAHQAAIRVGWHSVGSNRFPPTAPACANVITDWDEKATAVANGWGTERGTSRA
jgi:hypothetical protein